MPVPNIVSYVGCLFMVKLKKDATTPHEGGKDTQRSQDLDLDTMDSSFGLQVSVKNCI